MSLPSAIQLHYHCAFDLKPAAGANPSWTDLVKSIRAWIGEKLTTNDAYGSRWFFAGGEWKPPGQPRVVIKTGLVVGTGTEDVPQYWSIRYEHPCGDVPFRQWRTDIGITALGDSCFRFSLANMHWLLPDFIGQEPPVPLPSAPKIVGYTVSSRKWFAHAGSEQLHSRSVLLNVGSGNVLCDRIKDAERLCPLIFVTREFDTDKYLVDPHRLARLLAGTAIVYEATSKDVNNELEWLLQKSFRCWNGMVRVYQPQVDFDSTFDARRHRFFTKLLIQEFGPHDVEDMLIRGITRRSRTLVSKAVTSLEDLATRQREARLCELRKAADDTSKDEWIELLEQDNKEVAARAAKLSEEVAQLEGERDLSDVARDQDADNLAKQGFKYKQERQRAVEAESRARVLESQIEVVNTLSSLPANLSSVIGLIEHLHPNQIVFTEQAKQKAAKAKVHGQRSDMFAVWECLWHVATTLHDLYFDEDSKVSNIEQEFKARTVYDLSLREGESTRNDPKLMRLRKTTYKGETFDIEPHVKWDGPLNRHLRVYYHAHQEDRVILVGHCGDHLKTAGARRRKER